MMGLDDRARRLAARPEKLGADPADARDGAECHASAIWPEGDAEDWVERRWQEQMERHHGW